MAQQQQQQQHEEQEEGWPLGLRPLNARVGLLRNPDFNGSISFSTTMLTRTPSSTTISSSDLDTQSTQSFFHDKSITLGSLIGLSSILALSRRSMRGRSRSETFIREEQQRKPKPCIFSLCSRLTTDAVIERRTSSASSSSIAINNMSNPPSLGHFLEVERRASSFTNGSKLLEQENGYGSPLVLSCLCGQLIE
ncbi:hypothetical protein LINGRAHAP2_LOCUS14298 [Linum grandiflorum]